MRFAILAALALLVACATPSSSIARDDPLDTIAEDYVRLSLEIGTHEEGYIDAYHGPPAWKAEAEASLRYTQSTAQRTSDRGRKSRVA